MHAVKSAALVAGSRGPSAGCYGRARNTSDPHVRIDFHVDIERERRKTAKRTAGQSCRQRQARGLHMHLASDPSAHTTLPSRTGPLDRRRTGPPRLRDAAALLA